MSEELKLPPRPEPRDMDYTRWGYDSDDMDSYATDAVLADRAARPVADAGEAGREVLRFITQERDSTMPMHQYTKQAKAMLDRAAPSARMLESLMPLIEGYASKRALHSFLEASRVATDRKDRGPRNSEMAAANEADNLRRQIAAIIVATSTASAPAAPTLPDGWAGDVQTVWRCVRKHNNTIPDETLDLMRDLLLAATSVQGDGVVRDAARPDILDAMGLDENLNPVIEVPESVVRNAARYRWLRDKSQPGICSFYLSVGQAFKDVKFIPETVDQAIDAAITAASTAKGDA